MATFRNLPLSTRFDQHADKSKLSLDWVLNSGVPASHSVASGILTLPSVDGAFSAHMDIAVTSSLSFGIVLGRDWLQYCHSDLRQPPLGSPSKRGSDIPDPSSSSSFDASPVFPAAVMESPCVFHADLPALQHALALHGILYADMNLSQCRHALIHHIIT
ncbi:hypothetical protein B0H14DRAFT_2770090, partial [Mycena olivaceomarginata]